MPRVVPQVKGRRKFRKGELCRATEGLYFVDSAGVEHYVRTGQVYSADHEVVKSLPLSFCPADCPADEVLDWLRPPPEPVEYEPAFPGVATKAPEIPPERMVVCINGVGDLRRFVEPGQVVDGGTDRFVEQRPECFSPYRPRTSEDVERLRASGT
jgi:hypothetical protein